MTEAGWQPDPLGHFELRYWDGSAWTEHVSTQGSQEISPLDARPAPVYEEPVPAYEQPTPVYDEPAHAYEQPPAYEQPVYEQPFAEYAPPSHAATTPQGDAFAGLSGELVEGTYTEVEGAGPQRQNPKLLRVRLDQPFMAKQGAMVAYQGAVQFAYQGGGAAKFLKKAITGEGLSLMQVSGNGDVFLADEAKDVHILHLTNSGLSVSGKNVLAFSSSLDWNVERVKGGSMAAGGLFNTSLRGTGWVAITTDGLPVVLNAAEAPTFADANALVAWSINLQTSIKSSVSAGALIGRGSGEAFQVAFTGQGFVIVQPSEGPPPQPSS